MQSFPGNPRMPMQEPSQSAEPDAASHEAVKAILGELNEILLRLDKLDQTMAAIHVASAIDTLRHTERMP